jgi:hypothetical protein
MIDVKRMVERSVREEGQDVKTKREKGDGVFAFKCCSD